MEKLMRVVMQLMGEGLAVKIKKSTGKIVYCISCV
jgi:hypothetical protein